MICDVCQTENPAGNRFCGNCASPLERTCPNCGASNPPSMKFCGQCATSLETTEELAPAAKTERRLVTVLFADLTGYTTFSEGRDPEEVRKFLTGYFDRSRVVIERFGGLVEKFIGDAVMAVWGADTAHEDDAERAVRAGFELTELVDKLAADTGAPELRLRVGVHTGEAAVGPGEDHMGLVTGDMVNTASRLESAAGPGTVLVGDVTKQSASRGIAFESVGEQNLKGKSIPVTAWRAVRLLSETGGQGKAEALEPPFVGRTNELRLLKDVVDTVMSESQSRLVSLVGEAGIGKSRLVWELKKYTGGLVSEGYWHEGRSPAYGDGVTFWAAAEMIRGRARLLETADDEETDLALQAALETYVADPDDRDWLKPRLAAVLGTGKAPPGGRSELDAAVRAFFEGVASKGPVVMIFEDMHWADEAMLDFVEELTDWWRDQPIMIVTLARNDLLERRPTWGTGGTNVISLSLGPLNDTQMADLVTGTVPGVPEPSVAAIVERAAGVPLYAVELIRSLVAAGDLESDGDRYRVVGDLSELAVPDSLRAVIGARLDRFDPDDRDLIQDAAVLGQVFTVDALSQLTGIDAKDLEQRLSSISKREVITAVRDPRSAEHDQYRFVQSLIREVALSRMSKDLLRDRHLAVAEHMESLHEPELAQVVASHYLDALEATPVGEKRDQVRTRAMTSMKSAVERAVNVRAHEQVISISEQAINIADSAEERASFWERMAAAATDLNHPKDAERYANLAIDHYSSIGDQHSEWRATRILGFHYAQNSDWETAIELLEPIVTSADDLTVDEELARIAAIHARALSVVATDGDIEASRALELIEAALQALESLRLTPEIVDTMLSRATALTVSGRSVEAQVLLSGAIEVADTHGLYRAQTRGRNNLIFSTTPLDVTRSMSLEKQAREIATRAGDRPFVVSVTQTISALHTTEGDFEAAQVEADSVADDSTFDQFQAWRELFVNMWTGDEAAAESIVERLREVERDEQAGIDRFALVELEASREAFFGDPEHAYTTLLDAARTRVFAGLFHLHSLLLTGMRSGDPARLDELIGATGMWSILTIVENYLEELAQVTDGDLSVLPSLDKRLEQIIALPGVPLALVLMFGTAQYLPEDEPKRQELLDRARAIATERGWNGFLAFMDRP